MTLSDLLLALTQDLGYEPTPSASVTARLTRYLQEGYRHVLSLPEMGPLRLSTIPMVSAPGQKLYGVPQTLVQIDQIVDLTSSIRLRLLTLDQFRTIDPQETASGRPTHYIPVGLHPVQRNPDHTDVWVVCQLAADTTQIVTMIAVRDLDDIDTATNIYTATLNGLTPVLVASDIIAIQTLSLSPVATGAVGFFDAMTGGHRLATIQPGQRSVQYLGIRLWPTPADIYHYQIDGDLSMADLTTSNDLPVIPIDFQLLLADYARSREYEYRDDSRFPMAQARYEQKLQQLRHRIMDPPDYRPRVGRLYDRSNNLDHDGVNFPPGRF